MIWGELIALATNIKRQYQETITTLIRTIKSLEITHKLTQSTFQDLVHNHSLILEELGRHAKR